MITFGYAFARDQMMVDDMNELKDRIKVMTDTDINALKSSFSTLCSKVTEVTSVQGCDATPTCADEIVSHIPSSLPDKVNHWFLSKLSKFWTCWTLG